jgi:hypothetical protein
VSAYQRQLVSRLRAVLGDELVGVYAGGSFALGDFSPDRSDLDVAAVCRGHLPDETKRRVANALRHESLPCPARGLELVVYAETTVREPTPEAGYELDLNSGQGMPFRFSIDPTAAPRHWYVIDRAILHEHGRTLFGPSPRLLFAAIPREAVLRALVESVSWHETSEDARDDDAVLNACRAWRYAAEGTWSSKPAAGAWARARLEDPDLVSDALAARFGGPRRLDRARVAALLGRTRRLVEAAEGDAGRLSHS